MTGPVLDDSTSDDAGVFLSHRGEPHVSVAPPLPAPPRALLVLYVLWATVTFAVYAFTLWSNQHDPGRVASWIATVHDAVNGAL